MTKSLRFFLYGAALAITTPFSTGAQLPELVVVDNLGAHRQMVNADGSFRMVGLNTFIPTAKLHLRYATADNFTGQRLYPKGKQTYLRQPAATALHSAASLLAQQGFGIIIWDGYRPYRVTKRMWMLIKDERYVAHPSKGSGHNRGIAVDLTLYDLKNDTELDMGTGFDHFSDTAHIGFAGLTPLQQRNRSVLRAAMEQNGFRPLATEWWHFSFAGSNFPVLNLSFAQLKRAAD